mgnify:CR=1 FL=1
MFSPSHVFYHHYSLTGTAYKIPEQLHPLYQRGTWTSDIPTHEAFAETMMIGTWLVFRIWVQTVRPSIPGIMISRMQRSGAFFWNASRRDSPSPKHSTSYPSFSRKFSIRKQMFFSSSAT